jgi:hypothetical protein
VATAAADRILPTTAYRWSTATPVMAWRPRSVYIFFILLALTLMVNRVTRATGTMSDATPS